MGVAHSEPAGDGRPTPGVRLRLLAGGQEGGEPVEAGTASPLDSPRAPAEANGAPTRVLVADDEPSMRLLLEVNLGLAGFDVVAAANGAEALVRAAESRFDVALLDVMMPDLNGHELARKLRADAATSDLPVVFLSARASREDLRAGYELGALDYITKPFDPMEIAGRLTTVLERVRAGTAETLRLARLEELERI